MLVLLALMAVVPLLLVELVSSEREQGERVQRARQNIDTLAVVVANNHARLVEGIGEVLDAVALSPAVAGNDREACSRYLKKLLAAEREYANFGLIDLDGYGVCAATEAGVGQFAGDRDYFRQALQTGRLAVGTYQVGRITGRRVLVFARPVVVEGGRVKGVVYAALDLQWLDQSLPGRGAVQGASVQVTDAGGLVLAASDLEVEQLGHPLTDALLRDAIRARAGGLIDGPSGERQPLLRAVRPVQVNGKEVMYATVAIPVNQIIAPAVRNLRLRLASILAILLAVAVSVWWLGQRLVARPLERLVAGLHDIEAGEYGLALRQPVTPLREMTELQQSLGSLVMGLEAQRFERDQALAALSEREVRYRELFKANPQVMYVYHVRSLRFLAVNDAAVAYYGYTREEFLGMNLLDIRPVSERAALLSNLAGRDSVAAEHALPRQWVHQKKGGETRQVEVILSATVFDGQPAQLVMVTDITDRLAADARVREVNEKLEQRVAERTRELELSNQELEAFSYSVSHDLRNPLGAVAMFGQLLSAQLGDTLDAQGKLYLARIEQGVRGMERLIDDLLALAKVTRAELVTGPVDLTALCHAVLEELRERDPGRQVVVTLEDGLSCIGDERLLRRLLANLIGNAWKFTSHTPSARIQIGRQKGNAPESPTVFFVSDNGAGFDMKFVSRLFLPFERLHGDHDFPGTGIGLATVQRIVARHGGRVWAEAAIGEGATFYFVINSPETP